MGIYAEIFRSDYDCDLNAFHGVERLWIANANGPFEFRAGDAAALIVKGYYAGSAKVVPAYFENGEWLPNESGMFGGTYCAASDSRFGDTVERVAGYRWLGALAIHDRFEAN
jgi:hypothetical protein